MPKGGWCIDGLHDKDGKRVCLWKECDCWCHTPGKKPTKRVQKRRK